MQFDGIDVSKFKKLMWTLVSRAGDPKMSTLIQHTAKNASFDERMAILKGIDYISEPCVRALDFRLYFFELCQAYEYEGIQHFLDDESIQIFDALIKKTGGRYTLGIYDELVGYAKRKAKEFSQQRPPQRDIPAPKNICLNRSSLMRKHKLKEPVDVTLNPLSASALIDSIEQRILEEHYLNQNQTVSYVLGGAELGYRPLTEFTSEDNLDLLQFLRMDDEVTLAQALVYKPELKAVLTQTKSITEFYLAKKLSANDKLDFALVEFSSLPHIAHTNPELYASLLLDDVRLLRIDLISDELPDLFYCPSLLQSKHNVRLLSNNQKPSSQLAELAAGGEKFLTISDQTQALIALNLLQPHAKVKGDPNYLPNALVHYLIRPKQAPSKLFKAIQNSQERRREDRYACHTTCILVQSKMQQTLMGRTENMSSSGLLVSFQEDVALGINEEVVVSLPNVNKRLSRNGEKSLYRVVGAESNQVRLKAVVNPESEVSVSLVSSFLAKYQTQLTTSGKVEDLHGLTASLRNIASACHASIPFTYGLGQQMTYVQRLATNIHSRISNLADSEAFDDLNKMLTSDAFTDYVKQLYAGLMEGEDNVYGYLLLLPRMKDKAGREHLFWMQDLVEFAKKRTGYEFIHRLPAMSTPAVLSVRLARPKPLSGRHFIDELTHLQRVDPVAAGELPSHHSDILAYGELSDVTELFVSFAAKS